MKLINLQLTNIGTFEELDYDFTGVPILVQGDNQTDESQESNGSGKSWILIAIEYAINKTNSRKVTDADLVRWGQKQGIIQLEIYCPIRKESLVINRILKVKGSSTLSLEIWKDGAEEGIPQSFATVDDGGALISRWLDIDKKDLYNYFIINKERYKSFFACSNTEKQATINRFSNAKLVVGVDVYVEEDLTKLEGELKILEDGTITLNASISLTEANIEKEKNRDFKEELKTKKEEIEGSIEISKELIKTNKAELKQVLETKDKSILTKEISIKEKQELISLNKESKDKKNLESLPLTLKLNEVEKSLIELNKKNFKEKEELITDKLTKLKTDKLKVDKEVKENKLTKKEVEEILSDINKNLQGSVKCPNCSYEFIPGDEDVDIESEKEQLKEVESTITSIESILTTLDQKIEKFNKEKSIVGIEETKLDTEKTELQKQKDEIRKSVNKISDEIDEINKDIKFKESKIYELGLDIDTLNKSIERLKKDIKETEQENERKEVNILSEILDQETKLKNLKEDEIDKIRVVEWEKEIKGYNAELKTLETSIVNKNAEIFEVKQWLNNFKRFNMFLANKSLKVIQGYCNKFLQDIGSDIQIKWEGSKLLKNGELREKITAYIVRDNEERDYWSFSGGERARMDYTMILTMQHMINSTNKYGGLDFIFSDEICEGLDALGLADLMKALNNLKKDILITTHVVNRSVGTNILTVQKINKISSIKKEVV